jgi:hypothetical protein
MPRTPEVRHFHERATVRRTVTAATLAPLVASFCGAEDASPQPIPVGALPETSAI